MQVKEIMTRNVVECRATDSLHDAARIMHENDCGSVPVVSAKDEEPRLVGIITDRDICMAAMRKREPLQNLVVEDTMTVQPRSCRASDDLEEAERIMRSSQVRRIPVLDDENKLTGMLSLAQIARAGASSGAKGTTVGETLAAICEPTKESHVVDTD